MGFLDATRQNFLELKPQAVKLGQPVSFNFKKVGYAGRLYLRVKGTMKLTAADSAVAMKAVHGSRPFALFRNITIAVNDGFKPVQASGNLLSVLNIVSNPRAALDVPAASVVPAVTGNPVYQFAILSDADGVDNTWEFTLEVPFQINDLDQIGLLLAQNDKVEITCDIDIETAAGLFDLAAGETAEFDGMVYPLVEFFSVPADPKSQPFQGYVHQLVEEKYGIDSTGDTNIALKGGAQYLRTVNRVILNGSPAGFDDIERLQIAYNGSSYPYDVTYHSWLTRQRRLYGRDLPKGFHVYDFMHNGIPGYGTHRDWINSTLVSDLSHVVRVAGGATLGGNNNYVNVLREILVPIKSA
jgi:hypothetical protein